MELQTAQVAIKTAAEYEVAHKKLIASMKNSTLATITTTQHAEYTCSLYSQTGWFPASGLSPSCTHTRSEDHRIAG